MPNLSPQEQTTEFLLYTAPNGEVKVEVLLSNETLWLTQKRMAELFGVGVPAVSKHLDNIYDSNELHRKATISILETVQQEGTRVKKLERAVTAFFDYIEGILLNGVTVSLWKALPKA